MKKGIIRGITITTILLFALSNRSAIKVDAQSQPPLLSEMTEEACMNFLEENGIEIPEYLIGTSQCGTLVKDTIQLIEEEPDYPVYMNNREGNRFVKSIQKAVNAYYGIDLNTYVRRSSLPQYVYRTASFRTKKGIGSVQAEHGIRYGDSIIVMPMRFIGQNSLRFMTIQIIRRSIISAISSGSIQAVWRS